MRNILAASIILGSATLGPALGASAEDLSSIVAGREYQPVSVSHDGDGSAYVLLKHVGSAAPMLCIILDSDRMKQADDDGQSPLRSKCWKIR